MSLLYMNKVFSYLRKPRLLQRIWKKLISLFYFEQWAILIATTAQGNKEFPLWSDYRVLTPPRDYFWADPFPWVHNNQYYIFYEELPFATNRGHISCITLNKDMMPIANQMVIQQPYHLSYPFLFEYENQLFMMPETKENKTIEIYLCENFPNQWVLYKTIMSGVSAVDNTLFEENGKWWLFTNIAKEGGNAYDSLYLFYADSPLADTWTSHPLNPVVKNIQSARPAGRIFKKDNELIRPSQDCSIRYGYAINLNKITAINESEYSESLEQKITPPSQDKNILSTHTWNTIENLYVIDAEFWRRRF